jgi:FtsH-binding integral membrane protein
MKSIYGRVTGKDCSWCEKFWGWALLGIIVAGAVALAWPGGQ